MGNYCSLSLARAGCAEVSINTGKRSINYSENEHPHANIKRARRAKVNYLPNFPKGKTQATLEQMKVQICQEVEMTERNQLLIEKLMHTTSALHRKEIVENPQVRDFLESWPALIMESQVIIKQYSR